MGTVGSFLAANKDTIKNTAHVIGNIAKAGATTTSAVNSGGSRALVWGGDMASAGARAYNKGLGRSPQRGPGAESRGRAPGQGGQLAPLKMKRFF